MKPADCGAFFRAYRKFFRARQTRAANKTTLFAFLPYYYSKYRGQWQVNEGENFRAARKRARIPRFYALALAVFPLLYAFARFFITKRAADGFFAAAVTFLRADT